MVRQAHQNAVPFRYVLADSWYTNSDNINLVLDLKHHYLGAVKTNLEVALSKHDRANGKFFKISSLKLQPGTVLTVYIRSVQAPVAICGDILPNRHRVRGRTNPEERMRPECQLLALYLPGCQ
jgi:hypothetical protein